MKSQVNKTGMSKKDWKSVLEKLITPIPKNEIKDLPPYCLGTKEVVIVDKNSLKSILEGLNSEKILGFDTETRPAFTRGESYPISLVQISTIKTCYLFHSKNIGSFDCLKKVLESKTIIKVGMGLSDDFNRLKMKHSINLGCTVDVDKWFKKLGKKHQLGAKQFIANVLQLNLQKSSNASTSNWSQLPMRKGQIKYAAEDAAAPLDAFMHLISTFSLYRKYIPNWLLSELIKLRLISTDPKNSK
ncbi:MAG: 3'-5' exonuclease domain-containing protein 2 [Candidatus Delongbacteria bacterium]|jgi:ribonuclease D|nr:3'-5' exonuclease domain-containing protein 2 [Candidatus Delongbacteria bacterium]